MAFSSSPRPRLRATRISRGRAVRSDHEPQNACALVLRFAGFFRILRIRLINHARRAYSTTNTEHSATNATATAFSYAGAGAYSNSATRARANTTA